MLKNKLIDLQLFADGGDGGSAGGSDGVASGVGNEASGQEVKIPSFVPERAKKNYLKAVEKTRSINSAANQDSQTKEAPAGTSTANKEEGKKLSYSELIKSEEYKADHEAYMKDTIDSRLKKYKGIEERLEKANRITSRMAEKYGIDPNSETFFDDLEKASMKDDADSRVESYMREHDVPEEEARRIIGLETEIAEKKRAEEAQRIAEENIRKQQEQEKLRQSLMASAEETKKLYPNFDLSVELQNDQFKRICAVTGGNTTAAYVAAHHGEIIQSTARAAAEKANVQATNAVAANLNRPFENGLQKSAPSIAETDFSHMNAKELRAWWSENRRTRR